MANQIEHTIRRPANAAPRGALPITPRRARALALCTLSPASAVAFIRRGDRMNTREIAWCEASYLMVKGASCWRLTGAGVAALRLAFVAACESWPECPTCHRIKHPANFIGKRGQPILACSDCAAVKLK